MSIIQFISESIGWIGTHSSVSRRPRFIDNRVMIGGRVSILHYGPGEMLIVKTRGKSEPRVFPPPKPGVYFVKGVVNSDEFLSAIDGVAYIYRDYIIDMAKGKYRIRRTLWKSETG